MLDAQIAKAKTIASHKVPLIFVGVAMHSQSTAFQADAHTTQAALGKLVSAPFPSIILSNNFERKRLTYPFATTDSISRAIQAASEMGDAETPVVILLTTHGTYEALALAIGFKDYPLVRTDEMMRWLTPLGDRPVILIISACHAGSLVPGLITENRAIYFAAAAHRASFGCDVTSTNTYFVEELFGRHLDSNASLNDLMLAAEQRIAAREKKEKLTPSLPGSDAGVHMDKWVQRPLRQW